MTSFQNEARLQLAYCRLLSNAPRAAAILEGLLASKAPLPRSQCLDVRKFVGWLANLPGRGWLHPMVGGKIEDYWKVLEGNVTKEGTCGWICL